MNFGYFKIKKIIDGKEELRELCKEKGHISSKGIVSKKEGNLIAWDNCKRCCMYYERKPTESEIRKYKTLLN